MKHPVYTHREKRCFILSSRSQSLLKRFVILLSYSEWPSLTFEGKFRPRRKQLLKIDLMQYSIKCIQLKQVKDFSPEWAARRRPCDRSRTRTSRQCRSFAWRRSRSRRTPTKISLVPDDLPEKLPWGEWMRPILCQRRPLAIYQPPTRIQSIYIKKNIIIIKRNITSVKPPQHANVRAVSWVSSVWALMLAPKKTINTNGKVKIRNAFNAFTLSKKQVHHLLMALPGCLHEGRIALVVDLLDVGATLDQQHREVDVSPAGRQS